jgi:hypothetical protein
MARVIINGRALPILLLLIAVGRVAAEERSDGALWRPRLVTPAIVALDAPQNREFTAEVRASADARGWTATIANDLKSWNCEVVSAVYAKINRGTEPGWLVTVRVPADASPELFDLTITSSEAKSVQNQSVSVVPAFAADFYILHLADEQIVNERHTDPTGQYYRTVGTGEEMRWMQEPINLIHPRLVFITGDQIDFNGALDGWNNWHNWHYEPGAKRYFSRQETIDIENRLGEMYIESHRGYHVPYVEAPGNHDVTPRDKKLLGTDILWHPISVDAYERTFGQRTWSFRMGDFYVLMHDWSEGYLKDWAAFDYAAAGADPAVKFRLIGQHFIDDQGFVPPACDLMLVGHGHRVATLKTQPYYVYMDGPAFVYGMTGFFNFRRTSDGWTCDETAAPRDTAKDVWPLFTDHGAVKKVRCDQPDPMNVTTNTVTITNDLPREFYDGRVRFVLDKGEYRSVQNGTILAQYECANGTKAAVVTKVDIPANGTVTVTVAPAAAK